MLPDPTTIEELRELLEHELVVQNSEPWEAARTSLERTHRCLAELAQRRVTVGIFGGTGVGKSTLLNAIAETTISRSGDRRPTTDRVVCYRHTEFPLPDWLHPQDQAADVPPHDIDRLRGVILLDLPDTDSYKDEHRERVHRILPNLDLLIVVTSVDKYADQVLYDELNSFPQAPRNIIFVLNAIDRLTEPSAVETLCTDFSSKLERYAKTPDARIMALSALESLQGHEAGLRPLLTLLESLTGDEERQRVLTANADVAVAESLTLLEALYPPQEIDSWLSALDGVAASCHGRSVEESLAHEIESSLTPWLRDRALRASWFPIGWFYFLWRLRPWGRAQRVKLDLHTPTAPFAERALVLPARLASRQLADLVAQQKERFQPSLPQPLAARHEDDEKTHGAWVEGITRKAPRAGWKVRQHVLPVFVLLCTVLWVARPALGIGEEEGSWTDVPGRFLDLASRFSPIQWAITAAALLIYYLLAHTYFLYRIERTAQRESESAAQLFTGAWERRFEEEWSRPVAEQLRQLRVWWSEVAKRRQQLKDSQ